MEELRGESAISQAENTLPQQRHPAAARSRSAPPNQHFTGPIGGFRPRFVFVLSRLAPQHNLQSELNTGSMFGFLFHNNSRFILRTSSSGFSQERDRMFKDPNVSGLKRDSTPITTRTFLKRSRFYLNGAHDLLLRRPNIGKFQQKPKTR